MSLSITAGDRPSNSPRSRNHLSPQKNWSNGVENMDGFLIDELAKLKQADEAVSSSGEQ